MRRQLEMQAAQRAALGRADQRRRDDREIRPGLGERCAAERLAGRAARVVVADGIEQEDVGQVRRDDPHPQAACLISSSAQTSCSAATSSSMSPSSCSGEGVIRSRSVPLGTVG